MAVQKLPLSIALVDTNGAVPGMLVLMMSLLPAKVADCRCSSASLRGLGSPRDIIPQTDMPSSGAIARVQDGQGRPWRSEAPTSRPATPPASVGNQLRDLSQPRYEVDVITRVERYSGGGLTRRRA